MKTVLINDKEYPVIFSIQAMFWFADWLKVPIAEIGTILNSGMTERNGVALLYSGLFAGAEKAGKRLDISYYDFTEIVMFDDDLAAKLGALFQKQFEVTSNELMKKMEDKKKPQKSPSQLTTKKSTSD